MNYIKFLFVLLTVSASTSLWAQSISLDEALQKDFGPICTIDGQVFSSQEDQELLCTQRKGKFGYGARKSAIRLDSPTPRERSGKSMLEPDRSQSPYDHTDPTKR